MDKDTTTLVDEVGTDLVNYLEMAVKAMHFFSREFLGNQMDLSDKELDRLKMKLDTIMEKP